MELSEIRKDIDAIDEELVKLFCQRMALSAKVADYKKANNLPILVPAREREILKDVAEKAGLPGAHVNFPQARIFLDGKPAWVGHGAGGEHSAAQVAAVHGLNGNS